VPSQQSQRQVVAFDTALVEPRLRIPLWEDFNRRWISTVRCRTLTPGGLRTKVRCTEFAHIGVSELWGQGHFVERSREHILAGDTDQVYLVVLLRGEGHLLHADGVDRLSAGDAQVYDAGVPSLFGLLGDFHLVALRVRKNDLADLRADPVRAPVVIRASESGLLVEQVRAATHIAQAALRGPADPPDSAVRSIHGLFGQVLGSGAGSMEAYWLAARDHIRRNLHDPALDVAQVSSAVGLSTRHLARVFAGHDTTVARSILLARVEHARSLLLDTSSAARPIAEISRAAGFRSASQFSRSFRRVHGTSARDARRDPDHRGRTSPVPG
jgi:AraC-like DNA-binding protein